MLRREIEQHFRDEARKARKAGSPSPRHQNSDETEPGYMATTSDEFPGVDLRHGYEEYLAELREIRSQQERRRQ